MNRDGQEMVLSNMRARINRNLIRIPIALLFRPKKPEAVPVESTNIRNGCTP